LKTNACFISYNEQGLTESLSLSLEVIKGSADGMWSNAAKKVWKCGNDSWLDMN